MSHYIPGELVFSQGDDANALFIVKKGEVEVIKDGEFIVCVTDGSHFGENALLDNSNAKRSATVVAKTDVICLSLPRQTMLDIFGQDVKAIALTNYMRNAFNKSHILSQFTRIQQERIINQIKIKTIEKGETLFVKSQSYNEIILILEGNLIKKEVGLFHFLRRNSKQNVIHLSLESKSPWKSVHSWLRVFTSLKTRFRMAVFPTI